jgi:hypothetical protein
VGDWHTAIIGYMDPHDVRCALTGQLLPGRYWLSVVDGIELAFVDERHERLFRTYRTPERERSAQPKRAP